MCLGDGIDSAIQTGLLSGNKAVAWPQSNLYMLNSTAVTAANDVQENP